MGVEMSAFKSYNYSRFFRMTLCFLAHFLLYLYSNQSVFHIHMIKDTATCQTLLFLLSGLMLHLYTVSNALANYFLNTFSALPKLF